MVAKRVARLHFDESASGIVGRGGAKGGYDFGGFIVGKGVFGVAVLAGFNFGIGGSVFS
jgi:hypothetical protein